MEEYILNSNQKRILKKIDFLKKSGFYLAGGTTLALQLGHRTSKDLDFYNLKSFKNQDIVSQFRKVFKSEISEVRRAEDTLWLKVKSTDLSFFKYSYKLIQPKVPYLSVNLASMPDIAAMKIEAVIERGSKRDFVDIYYLMKKYGLEKILTFFRKKYPGVFNEQNCLHALLYFKDAETRQKDRARLYLYENIDWKNIKRYIDNQVKEYQLNVL